MKRLRPPIFYLSIAYLSLVGYTILSFKMWRAVETTAFAFGYVFLAPIILLAVFLAISVFHQVILRAIRKERYYKPYLQKETETLDDILIKGSTELREEDVFIRRSCRTAMFIAIVISILAILGTLGNSVTDTTPV